MKYLITILVDDWFITLPVVYAGSRDDSIAVVDDSLESIGETLASKLGGSYMYSGKAK